MKPHVGGREKRKDKWIEGEGQTQCGCDEKGAKGCEWVKKRKRGRRRAQCHLLNNAGSAHEGQEVRDGHRDGWLPPEEGKEAGEMA